MKTNIGTCLALFDAAIAADKASELEYLRNHNFDAFVHEAASELTNNAFDAAAELGWSAFEDEEFDRWALKATQAELLREGRSRFLKHCALTDYVL